jgi:hypothetical protein
VPPFLISVVLLALLVAAGIVAIVTIRARWLATPDDQGDWERTLADYKNLREQGVLSEEEFRNIRTLVEPRTRIGAPPLDGRQRPSVDAGPNHGRN